jgi:hypothetical protein
LPGSGAARTVRFMGRDGDTPRDLWAGLAFAAVFALLFAHGWVLAREPLLPVAGGFRSMASAAAAALSLGLVVALGAGTEGTEATGKGGVLSRLLPSLIPALLLAASPLFARGVFLGAEGMVFTALLLAGGYRAFVETHTPGRLPISAVCFGLAAALDRAGLLALVFVAVQKLVFARNFRLPRAVYGFAFVWLGVGLLAAAVAFWLAKSGPYAAAGMTAVGIGRAVAAFFAAIDGLALVPFVTALFLAWKPKEVYFRLTLAAAVLVALVVMAGRAPEESLGRALAPALPWAFLIAGEALRSARAVLETAGFRARERRILGVIVIGSLALAQLWPTLIGLLSPGN